MEASRFPLPRIPVAGRLRWRELGVAVLASVVAGAAVAASGEWKVALAVSAGAGLLVVGLLFPVAFVAVFLVARPLVDGISDTQIVAGVNAAGFLALLVMAVTIVVLSARDSVRSPLPGIHIAFVVVLVLSVLAAIPALVDHGEELGSEPLEELARLGSLFAMFTLAYHLFRNLRRVRDLFVVAALSAVIPAFVGIYQWMSGVRVSEQLGFGRLEGTFFGPNPYAIYLASAAVILVGLPRNALSRTARFAALAPILLALFETYSRAGLALFVISVILLELRQRKLVVPAAVVAAAVFTVSVPTLAERVIRSETTAGPAQTAVPSSFTWRLNNWDGLLEKYAEKPAIGHGLRTTEHVNPSRARRSFTAATPENPSGTGGFSPHNSAVKLLVEGGPLLLAAWAVLFAALILGMRRIVSEGGPLRRYAQILFALWISLLVLAVTATDSIDTTASLFALLALTGAVVGARAQMGQAPLPSEHPVPR